MLKRVYSLSEKGIKTLGSLAREARLAQGWSMSDVSNHLFALTGQTITPSAVSDLESGRRKPQWDTLAKLEAIGYIKHPTEDRPITTCEMFLIACEYLAPTKTCQ